MSDCRSNAESSKLVMELRKNGISLNDEPSPAEVWLAFEKLSGEVRKRFTPVMTTLAFLRERECHNQPA